MDTKKQSSIPAKILIVDDEESVATLLNKILDADGYQVKTASNGIEAVSIVEEFQPDLILMDITMPEMDGYEATSQIKNLPGLADIPVIFLSGKSAEEDGGQSFARGGLTFIRKPFQAQQIKDLVKLTMQSVTDNLLL